MSDDRRELKLFDVEALVTFKASGRHWAAGIEEAKKAFERSLQDERYGRELLDEIASVQINEVTETKMEGPEWTERYP